MANAGQFQKGDDPRRNTDGRASITKAKRAPGFDAVPGYTGTIRIGERDHALRGRKRWETFADLYRLPPVTVWARLRNALFSGVTWTVVENESGSKNAKRGVEIVENGLVRARLRKPFNALAAESLQGAAAFGHSLHAVGLGRKKDGSIVYTDVALRPQSSIYEWHRANDSDPSSEWAWVLQRVETGQTQRIELGDCLYVTNCNGTVTTNPLGVGMLELIYDRARLHGIYERIEGTEIVSSMGGIPIARIPLGKLLAQVQKNFSDKTEAEQLQLAQSIGRDFETFIAERYKNPDKLQYWVLDSATYQGADPNTISSIYEWGLEIIKGDLQGLAEIGAKERALILDVARMLGVEHMFIGGDSTGAYSMHESKILTLAADLNSELELWSYYADQQLVRPLIAANLLDPDEDAPTLQPSSVMPMDVAKVVDTLARLALTGLPKNGLAMKAIFAQLELPHEEVDEPMLPRGFGFDRGSGAPVPAPSVGDSSVGGPNTQDPSADTTDAGDVTEEEQPQ